MEQKRDIRCPGWTAAVRPAALEQMDSKEASTYRYQSCHFVLVSLGVVLCVIFSYGVLKLNAEVSCELCVVLQGIMEANFQSFVRSPISPIGSSKFPPYSMN